VAAPAAAAFEKEVAAAEEEAGTGLPEEEAATSEADAGEAAAGEEEAGTGLLKLGGFAVAAEQVDGEQTDADVQQDH